MSTWNPMGRDEKVTVGGPRSALLLAWACALIVAQTGWSTTGPYLHTWQRWEHALTSTRTYTNPYAEVTLRVIYTGPAGQRLQAYGFWDGGDTFRIRCAFPTPGTWRWETGCSDAAHPGLHQQRGTVVVAPYAGDGVLYRHGFLKVSENRRYLAYQDGTPFLWIGDTAWAVPQRATDEEWAAYIADRAAKHFPLLQVAPAPAGAGPSDRHGPKPFTDPTCSPWKGSQVRKEALGDPIRLTGSPSSRRCNARRRPVWRCCWSVGWNQSDAIPRRTRPAGSPATSSHGGSATS